MGHDTQFSFKRRTTTNTEDGLVIEYFHRRDCDEHELVWQWVKQGFLPLAIDPEDPEQRALAIQCINAVEARAQSMREMLGLPSPTAQPMMMPMSAAGSQPASAEGTGEPAGNPGASSVDVMDV